MRTSFWKIPMKKAATSARTEPAAPKKRLVKKKTTKTASAPAVRNQRMRTKGNTTISLWVPASAVKALDKHLAKTGVKRASYIRQTSFGLDA